VLTALNSSVQFAEPAWTLVLQRALGESADDAYDGAALVTELIALFSAQQGGAS
jgi:hypothetical protein